MAKPFDPNRIDPSKMIITLDLADVFCLQQICDEREQQQAAASGRAIGQNQQPQQRSQTPPPRSTLTPQRTTPDVVPFSLADDAMFRLEHSMNSGAPPAPPSPVHIPQAAFDGMVAFGLPMFGEMIDSGKWSDDNEQVDTTTPPPPPPPAPQVLGENQVDVANLADNNAVLTTPPPQQRRLVANAADRIPPPHRLVGFGRLVTQDPMQIPAGFRLPPANWHYDPNAGRDDDDGMDTQVPHFAFLPRNPQPNHLVMLGNNRRARPFFRPYHQLVADGIFAPQQLVLAHNVRPPQTIIRSETGELIVVPFEVHVEMKKDQEEEDRLQALGWARPDDVVGEEQTEGGEEQPEDGEEEEVIVFPTFEACEHYAEALKKLAQCSHSLSEDRSATSTPLRRENNAQRKDLNKRK